MNASKATATLILVALVGCGPKPAPEPRITHPGIRDNYMEGHVTEPYSIGWDAHDSLDPYHLREKADAIATLEPPPIDPNPYRFIGGQRYGEGSLVYDPWCRNTDGDYIACKDWTLEYNKKYPQCYCVSREHRP